MPRDTAIDGDGESSALTYENEQKEVEVDARLLSPRPLIMCCTLAHS